MRWYVGAYIAYDICEEFFLLGHEYFAVVLGCAFGK